MRAGLEAKKGQIIIVEDGDRKEALPVENKDERKQRDVQEVETFLFFAGWMIRKCSAQKGRHKHPEQQYR